MAGQAALPDDFEVTLALEQQAHAAPEERRIVGEEEGGSACGVSEVVERFPASRVDLDARRTGRDARTIGAGCERLWLITTNDNTPALRFYHKRVTTLVALRANAVAASRQLKPEIPLIGHDGIPIRDKIELEIALDGDC